MGFKHSDIQKCLLCREGIGHAGDFRFHRMTLESFQIDVGAVRRAHGLELQMGGHAALANLMGPDEDLAKALDEKPLSFIVCDTCYRTRKIPLALIRNLLNEQAHKADTG